MKRIAKGLIAALLALCLAGPKEVFASDPLTNHLTNWPYMEDISEDSAVLIDAANGAILYSLNRDTKRYPASITKVMTCLLVLENAGMDEIVTMTETGMAEAYGGSSNVDPVLGEQFTVEQCLYMLMLKSANDIASQLAEYVGGSVAGFADMMNQRALALGCEGTHFHNANGLPDEEHWTTAYDMALIMREALGNEEFRKIAGTVSYTVPPTNKRQESRYYENHFRLIVPTHERYYEYAIAGKTGYTDAAQRTLVGAASKDGRTLVAVTMHGPSKDDFLDMKRLFEYGFNQFKTLPLSEEGGLFEGSVTVPAGFTLTDLTRVEAGDRVDYYYEDLFVGGAERTTLPATHVPSPAAGETSLSSQAESAAASLSSQAESAAASLLSQAESADASPADLGLPEISEGSSAGGVEAESKEAPLPAKPAGKQGLLIAALLLLFGLLAGIVAFKRHLEAEREKKRRRKRRNNAGRREGPRD